MTIPGLKTAFIYTFSNEANVVCFAPGHINLLVNRPIMILIRFVNLP